MKIPATRQRPAWVLALAAVLVVVMAALLVIVFGSR
jgi:hypothetical protein